MTTNKTPQEKLTLKEKLTRVQLELHAPKNKKNNFGNYNYRTVDGITAALKPLLLKFKATVHMQDELIEFMNIPTMKATVIFSDLTGSITVNAYAGINPSRKGQDIAQSFGTSSTYSRKYALQGMFLIDDSKQYLKDNPEASDPDSLDSSGENKESKPKDKPKALPAGDEKLPEWTAKQRKHFMARCKEIDQDGYQKIKTWIANERPDLGEVKHMSEKWRNALIERLKTGDIG
jgi:hypothetical protein